MRSYLCIAAPDASSRRVDFDRLAELFAGDEESAPAEAAPASAWMRAIASCRETAAAVQAILTLLRQAAGDGRTVSRAFSA